MDSLTGSRLVEIAFYAAVVVLLALFFVKKYKQIKNTEKDPKNKP
jgi:hypothetical protein